MGTGSFPGVNCGRGVLLNTHPLLVPRLWKSRAIPLPTLWITTGPVTGLLYLVPFLILLSNRRYKSTYRFTSAKRQRALRVSFFLKCIRKPCVNIGYTAVRWTSIPVTSIVFVLRIIALMTTVYNQLRPLIWVC
jgi:hypothetical protein